MNKELMELLKDLGDFEKNKVPINLKSLKNTIKLCKCSLVIADGSSDPRIGILDNTDLYSFEAVCIVHYTYIDEYNILITSIEY